MATEKDKTTSKTTTKKPSKGQRVNTRRIKQAARNDGAVYRSPNAHRAPKKTTGE
ncbi:MAG: hypothetical protein L6461_20740 [Anaerolineae bacterium]|nr:hypothetical protein [Anaerolineae bacterium]